MRCRSGGFLRTRCRIAVTMLGLLAFLVLNERGDRARLAVAPAAAAEPFQGTARLDARPEPA